AGVADEVKDLLRWNIEDVESIKAAWSDHDGDVHTGKGLTTTATFTTPATGLPASNSAFGAKVVTLTTGGTSDVLTTNVEIFYPRDASNHAGGQAGSPNWFH